MALSEYLRKRVVEAVVSGGLSRNAAAKRFAVGIASAVRWVKQFETTGEMSPKPSGGDRRSGRVEAHRDYLMGLIRRTSDVTLLEIRERLIKNCGEHFSSSVLWRFFDRHGVTFKKDRARHGAAALGRAEATPRMVRGAARSRSRQARLQRRNDAVLDRGEIDASSLGVPEPVHAAIEASPALRWKVQNVKAWKSGDKSLAPRTRSGRRRGR